LKIAVFNFTSDALRDAVLERHKAGVNVQIITDDECMNNLGSDIKFLAAKGIAVRCDSSPEFHMHNKFVIVDNIFLLTGSFNWTVQAGKSNQENMLVVDHPYYLEKYNTEFERLWKEFAANAVASSKEELEAAAMTIQNAYRSRGAYQTGNNYQGGGGGRGGRGGYQGGNRKYN